MVAIYRIPPMEYTRGMTEELPKSPFRERQDSAQALQSEEIRAASGVFNLTRRYRAKVPENPSDVDKPAEDINESVGDHIAMSAYLMHYFLPLLEGSGENLDYERTFDMVLTQDIGAISNLPDLPGVQKTPEQRREEIISTAKIFDTLPKRDGFNRSLFNAYAEYLGQETREARFVGGVNGLETMLYVLSKPHNLRADLVGGKGYALEDYRERIAPFCR